MRSILSIMMQSIIEHISPKCEADSSSELFLEWPTRQCVSVSVFVPATEPLARQALDAMRQSSRARSVEWV